MQCSIKTVLFAASYLLAFGYPATAHNHLDPASVLDSVEATRSQSNLFPGEFVIEKVYPTLSLRFPTSKGTDYILEQKNELGQWIPVDLKRIEGSGRKEVFHVSAINDTHAYRIRALTAKRDAWENAMQSKEKPFDFPENLRLHLDSNADESLLLIDEKVYAWRSLVGQIDFETWRHYNPKIVRKDSGSSGPSQYISFPGASMDGASQELRDLFTNAEALTFFGVAKNRGSGAQSYLRVTTGDSDLKVRADFMRTLSDHRFRGRNRDNDSMQTVIGGNRENEVWSIDTTVVDYSQAEVFLYQNGLQTGRSFSFQTPRNSDPAPPRRLRLGSDTRDEPRFFFDGEMAAILLFDRRLSRDEVNIVGLYLSEKYDLEFTPVLEETIPHEADQTARLSLRMADGHRYSVYVDALEVDTGILENIVFPVSSTEPINPVKPFQSGQPLLVSEAMKTTGERLYNNIILPRQWPPRTENPDSDEPMRVPYLIERPEVINVGIGRQLFVDDFLIEDSSLERQFHYPTPYENNPVLQPETEFELQRTVGSEGTYEAVAYLGHGGFFFDPHTQTFRMYYTAGWRGPLVMATSQNLVDWERPDLDGKGNNIAWAEGGDEAGWDNSIWIDIERDPSEPRIHYLTQRPGASHTLHLASDNHDWSEGVETGIAADYTSFFHNPFRGTWGYSIKRNTSRGRARDYAESTEFLAEGIFDQSVFWVNADRKDPPDPEVGDEPQLYSLNAVAYESLMLGVFYVHRGPNNTIAEEGEFPKNTDLHLAYSRDGFHWHRPDRNPFLAGSRIKDAWDRAYLHSTTGVLSVVGDHLIFPYTGFSGLAPTGNRGMYNGAAIGIASLRRDGFASLFANENSGSITTLPLDFEGGHLFVNVDNPSGELQVEILDHEGYPIPGFTKGESHTISTDATLQEVTWEGSRSLHELQDQHIRLRFHLRNGHLYSFWFSPNSNGASGGFLGASGPGFSGFKDIEGKSALDNPLISKINEALSHE